MTNHPNRSKVGRPAVAPEDQTKRMAFRFAPDLAQAIEALEGNRTTMVSAILRKALIG